MNSDKLHFGPRLGMALARRFIRWLFPEVPGISVSELDEWIRSGRQPAPQLLDARSVEEWRVSKIPGAQRVDAGRAGEPLVKGLAPGRPVVVYCAAGYRSAKVARRLIQAGVKDVLNLEGSIFAWANAGLPLESDGVAVEKVHTCGLSGSWLVVRGRRG